MRVPDGVKPWRTPFAGAAAPSPGAWRAVRIGSSGRPRTAGASAAGWRIAAWPAASGGRGAALTGAVPGRLGVGRAGVDGPVGVRVLLSWQSRSRRLARPRERHGPTRRCRGVPLHGDAEDRRRHLAPDEVAQLLVEAE